MKRRDFVSDNHNIFDEPACSWVRRRLQVELSRLRVFYRDTDGGQ